METNAAPDPLPPVPPAPPPVKSVITPPDPAKPRKLSEELALILREFEVEQVTLREVIGLMQRRGYLLLVMLISLPFCTPIPLPGLSTPLGLVIGIIGVRLALGQKPWLPARLLDLRLPPAIFKKVFAVTQKIILWFERLLRPRLLWLTATPGLRQLHAIPIVICAALLLLPLPIPFSNTVPAWSIMLIAGGLLERDGGFIVAGHIAALLAIAFFTVIGIFGVEAVDFLWKWAK
jgi:hypothetical protein